MTCWSTPPKRIFVEWARLSNKNLAFSNGPNGSVKLAHFIGTQHSFNLLIGGPSVGI